MIPDDRFDLCSASYYGMQGLPDFESYAQYYLLQVREKRNLRFPGLGIFRIYLLLNSNFTNSCEATEELSH